VFQDPDRPSVLLLDDGREADFARMLALLAPGLAVASCGSRLTDWLNRVAAADLGGLVASAAVLGRTELAALETVLVMHPHLEILLLVGDRGLAGAEHLLGTPGLSLLPEPWTPAGLRRVLSAPASGSAPPAPQTPPGADPVPSAERPFPAAFVAGAVEGLRDPLASLSGYLQLLEGRREAGDLALLHSAQSAAHEIEHILEAVQLASGARAPRPRPVKLRRVVEEALRALARQAPLPDFTMQGEREADIDPRFLAAALYTGRLLLERFGPSGRPRLDCHAQAGELRLVWSVPAPSAPPIGALSPPPPFLSEILERLAQGLGARARIETVGGAVPLSAGLVWPA